MGVLIGLALLVFGLATGRVVLATAGGFVLIASLPRLLKRRNNNQAVRQQYANEWRR